jgi:hypothetical protein
MRMFTVTVGSPDGARREIVVPSKTEVQAQDAAVSEMKSFESILSVEERDDPYQQADTMPPGTQTHPDRPV